MDFSKIYQGRHYFMDAKMRFFFFFLLRSIEIEYILIDSFLKATAAYYAGTTAAMDCSDLSIRTDTILGKWLLIA